MKFYVLLKRQTLDISEILYRNFLSSKYVYYSILGNINMNTQYINDVFYNSEYTFILSIKDKKNGIIKLHKTLD